MKQIDVVVLAAGLGTRMKSKWVKVLHPLCGKPLILHLLDRIKSLEVNRIILVLGHQGKKVKEVVKHAHTNIQFVYQEKQLGTGHALAQAEKLFLGPERTLLVLNGDTPFISQATLTTFIQNHDAKNAVLSLLTVELERPAGYGRILRDGRGKLKKIIEEKDASAAQKQIREINSGVYIMNSKFAFEAINRLTTKNAQKEYYLTDILSSGVVAKQKIESMKIADADEIMGINTRVDLSRAEKLMRSRIAEKWMNEGVTLIDPERTYIDDDVEIGRDTVIYPGVLLVKGSIIGEDCTILSSSAISNSKIKNGVMIREFCVISDSKIEEGAEIGPFARLRPGTVLKRETRIGNFVEVKKSEIGEGSKVNHLSYIGDSVIGKRVNVGAGTITCNYDGVHKHQTIIGDDVFIGSDTQLIAPVKVERGSLIGAGSTIVKDVPEESLSLSRPNQIIKRGWVSKRKEKHKK